MVLASPAAGAAKVPSSTGVEVNGDDLDLARARGQQTSCALCGRTGRFVRHETLARSGRLEEQRRFRWRRDYG